MSDIDSLDRLRTHKLLKISNKIEPYIFLIDKYHLRRYFAKLRCGSLGIGVNVGRMQNIPYAQRICTYCNIHEIDDEFHFLLRCRIHSNIRRKYIPRYCTYPNQDSLLLLLNTGSKYLCNSVANYIKHAMLARQELDMIS